MSSSGQAMSLLKQRVDAGHNGDGGGSFCSSKRSAKAKTSNKSSGHKRQSSAMKELISRGAYDTAADAGEDARDDDQVPERSSEAREDGHLMTDVHIIPADSHHTGQQLETMEIVIAKSYKKNKKKKTMKKKKRKKKIKRRSDPTRIKMKAEDAPWSSVWSFIQNYPDARQERKSLENGERQDNEDDDGDDTGVKSIATDLAMIGSAATSDQWSVQSLKSMTHYSQADDTEMDLDASTLTIPTANHWTSSTRRWPIPIEDDIGIDDVNTHIVKLDATGSFKNSSNFTVIIVNMALLEAKSHLLEFMRTKDGLDANMEDDKTEEGLLAPFGAFTSMLSCMYTGQNTAPHDDIEHPQVTSNIAPTEAEDDSIGLCSTNDNSTSKEAAPTTSLPSSFSSFVSAFSVNWMFPWSPLQQQQQQMQQQAFSTAQEMEQENANLCPKYAAMEDVVPATKNQRETVSTSEQEGNNAAFTALQQESPPPPPSSRPSKPSIVARIRSNIDKKEETTDKSLFPAINISKSLSLPILPSASNYLLARIPSFVSGDQMVSAKMVNDKVEVSLNTESLGKANNTNKSHNGIEIGELVSPNAPGPAPQDAEAPSTQDNSTLEEIRIKKRGAAPNIPVPTTTRCLYGSSSALKTHRKFLSGVPDAALQKASKLNVARKLSKYDRLLNSRTTKKQQQKQFPKRLLPSKSMPRKIMSSMVPLSLAAPRSKLASKLFEKQQSVNNTFLQYIAEENSTKDHNSKTYKNGA